MARGDVRLEWAVPAVRGDLLALDEQRRRIALGWLGRARRMAAPTEQCADRRLPLDGCLKVRFDVGDEPWQQGSSPPRTRVAEWRIVLEYLPHDHPERLLVWAIGLGHPPPGRRLPNAYTLAGRRRAKRLTVDPEYRKEARR